VGGIVAQSWGWRWLFLLNLPLGVLVAAAAWGLLVPDPRRREGRVEVQGFLALSAALLGLSLAVLGAPGAGSGWARGGFGGLALLFGAWFVLAERRAAVPLVDLGAILRPSVLAASLALFVALLIMDGGMFLSVLYAQLLGGVSPAAIGLLLAPCATAAFALAPAGGWLAHRIGPRVLAVAGLVGLAASVAIPVRWHPASAASLVFWSNLIAGSSIGLATPALVLVATDSVPRQRVGLGAGVYKTVNELGGVFGVVLLGTFLESRIIANALRQIPGHAETEERIERVLRIAAAEADALAARTRDPAAPARDALLAGAGRPHRAAVERLRRVRRLVAIGRPFPHIADEVVDAESIWLEGADRRHLAEAVVAAEGRPVEGTRLRAGSVIHIGVLAGLGRISVFSITGRGFI
jgi:MFS family permease